jgi:hypothetical protein
MKTRTVILAVCAGAFALAQTHGAVAEIDVVRANHIAKGA